MVTRRIRPTTMSRACWKQRCKLGPTNEQTRRKNTMNNHNDRPLTQTTCLDLWIQVTPFIYVYFMRLLLWSSSSSSSCCWVTGLPREHRNIQFIQTTLVSALASNLRWKRKKNVHNPWGKETKEWNEPFSLTFTVVRLCWPNVADGFCDAIDLPKR